MHMCMCVCVCTYIYICNKYMHAYIHTYMHTYIQTYIHTDIDTYIMNGRRAHPKEMKSACWACEGWVRQESPGSNLAALGFKG